MKTTTTTRQEEAQYIWEGGSPLQYKVRFDGGLSKLYEGFDWLETISQAQHRIWGEYGMRAGWNIKPDEIFGKRYNTKGEYKPNYDWEAPEHCWKGEGEAPTLAITYWEDIDCYLIGVMGDRVKDGYYYPCHADYVA